MPDRKTCARCGAEFDPSDWYPTATSQDGSGLEIYAFCSQACRTAWRRTTPDGDG